MRILRETEHDVAVVKPSGMATEMRVDQPGESLLAKLQAAYPDRTLKLPHRLDKVTRGIVLAALSSEAIRYYNNEIQNGLWDKYYVGRIKTPLSSDGKALLGRHKAFLKQKGGRSVIVRSGGAPSFLEILAIEPAPLRPDESHVWIRLLTGRYHQIRVMLEGLGIPLVGDPLYPGSGLPLDSGRFYLEHVLLRYRDFSTGELVTLYFKDDPDREPISEVLKGRLAALSERELPAVLP